jgi:dihydrofolate reductase
MRKVFLFNLITLDGFFAGPTGDLDWHVTDEEFNRFAVEQLDETDTLLFGRVTYELMAGYWPTDEARANEPLVAKAMNEQSKIVFSRTLKEVDWSNSRLVSDHAEEEVRNVKQQPGKDIAIFGSANLAASLMPSGLIDEFRVLVNPVILGAGRPLFEDVKDPLKLRLIRTRTFGSGSVLLYYEPAGNVVAVGL